MKEAFELATGVIERVYIPKGFDAPVNVGADAGLAKTQWTVAKHVDRKGAKQLCQFIVSFAPSRPALSFLCLFALPSATPLAHMCSCAQRLKPQISRHIRSSTGAF